MTMMTLRMMSTLQVDKTKKPQACFKSALPAARVRAGAYVIVPVPLCTLSANHLGGGLDHLVSMMLNIIIFASRPSIYLIVSHQLIPTGPSIKSSTSLQPVDPFISAG